MAITTLRADSAPANPDYESRLRNHKINGVSELMDTGFEAVQSRLYEAHAVLCVISAAIDQGANGEFGTLNQDIQRSAIDAVQHLIAEAEFHAHEMQVVGSPAHRSAEQ